MASSSRQTYQRHMAKHMLQSDRIEDHFRIGAAEDQIEDKSYRSVVPKEYDYMAHASTRSKAPIRIDMAKEHKLKEIAAQNEDSSRSWHNQLSNRSQRKQVQQKRPAEDLSSLAMMYEPIETAGSSGNQSRRNEMSSKQDQSAYASERIRREEKNAFWDCLDEDMWVKDDKVTSCMYCKKDFKMFTRRRHHCRKCGKIFCSNCSSIRKIEHLERRICTDCAKAYDNYTKSSAGMLLQRANYDAYAKQQQMAFQVEQDYMRVTNTDNMNDTRGSEQVAAGSVYIDHMQNQFGSNDKSGGPLGFAPILDQNASLMSDTDSLVGPSYMDEQFNNRRDQSFELASNTSQTNQFNHLNKNAMERLGEYSHRHIQKVVTEQLYLNELSCKKWEVKLTDFVLRAVEAVKPSSRMFGDQMDINRFVKVKIIDWRDNSKSQYVNGLVMSKSIASRRMAQVVPNPRILLLKSLGQDDIGNSKLINSDLAQEINAEDQSERIMHQKLAEINPNVVIIQHDIPVKLLNMMRDREITVVCNLDEKKMNRLARLLKTIPLPSIYVHDGAFSLGQCKLFREDNLTRQAREQGAAVVGTHNVEQTLITFDGCDPQSGCTICLSGPMSKEGKELHRVKKALKSMLTLARNIVLERYFLLQIQCQVTDPPFVEADDQNTERLKQGGKGELEDVLKKWDITDSYSPYLITNNIQNRSTLVYKRIKIILKQRDEPIPNGPSAIDHEDIIQQGLDNTLGEFIRENADGRRDTINDSLNPAEVAVNINEKFVQTKLDKMCGQPKDSILYFSRQDLRDPEKKKRNDQTLGRYLEELCETAKKKCDECHQEKHMHSQEIYHRDGQIQITIRPHQMTGAHTDDQVMVQTSSGQAQQDLFPQLNPMIKQQYRQANQRRTIMIYAQCKTCHSFSERSPLSMQLYEYSKARFFEQFFYNDKLMVKQGVFKCDHGTHPLRDYIIEFLVDQTKIRFCYTQIDNYRIQLVYPQKYPQHDCMRKLVEQRKEKLQDVLEEALDHFKHDQIEKLKGLINQTMQQHDMTNESKFRSTNMPVFVVNFERILQTLEKMKDDFREFQEEAAKELAKFKDELLLMMFLQRKILMTFLGYQRTIDEVIQQLALLIVLSRRRAIVIEYQQSKDGGGLDGRTTQTMVDGDEISLTVASQSIQLNSGSQVQTQSRNNSMVDLEESHGSVQEPFGSNVKLPNELSNNQMHAEVVAEELKEEESDMSSSMKSGRRKSNDDMASVGNDQIEGCSSDASGTSIHRMDESFRQGRARSGAYRRSMQGLRPSLTSQMNRNQMQRTSFASSAERHKKLLTSSIDDASSVGSTKPQKRIFGKLQRKQVLGGVSGPSSVKSSVRGNDSMLRGRRKLMDSRQIDDSMMEELDLEEEYINRNAQKRCFIEELCICELSEGTEDKSKTAQVIQSLKKRIVDKYPALITKVSNSVKIQPGDFKHILLRGNTTNNAHENQSQVNLPSPSQANERKEDGSGGAPVSISPTSQSEQKLKELSQSMHTDLQPRATFSNQNNVTHSMQTGYGAAHQLHNQPTMSRPTTHRRGVTFCQISGQFSCNKFCSNVQHVAQCYQQIVEEVRETRILIQKIIYRPAEVQVQLNQTSITGARTALQDEMPLTVEEISGSKAKEFTEQKLSYTLKQASQIDGFDTIAIEKRPKDTMDPTSSECMLNAQTNRHGGDLRQNFDFIQMPRESAKRGDSPNPLGKENVKELATQKQLEKLIQDPWLSIPWLTKLAKKSYPTLPFGVDNTSLKVNPQDMGSIIAYAMTSNIYIEGLSKVKYMALDEIMAKQQDKSSNQGFELLDQDDVLNHKHVDKNRIEAMMLSRNKISFTIKFSTHSKDVSMTVKEERQKQTYNHSTRAFKTGYTEKRQQNSTTLNATDLQSEAGSTSDYSQTVRTKQSIQGATKGKKPKKIFNDYHLRVLPKYPKEYLRCGNIMEVINELYEVQSDLCLSYFSQEQITATNCLLNNNKDCEQMGSRNIVSGKYHSPDTASNMNNQSHMNDQIIVDQSLAYEGGDLGGDESMAILGQTQPHDMSLDISRDPDVASNMMYASAAGNMSHHAANEMMAGGDKRTQRERRRLRKRQKQEPAIDLHLEEGSIFGVKSPANSISDEQNHAISYINDGLKIPKIDFEVTIQYPKRFQAMRRYYAGTHLDFINSICKTNTFKSSGGKASMGFLTSHDKKFIFKSVKKEEFENFCQFAPNYFDYLNRCFFHNHACALAKIVGAYEVKVTCAADQSLNEHLFYLVSENLNLGLKKEDEQNIIRYDLKGSENNRLVTPPIGPDGLPERVVLLDNNFLYKMRARPMVLTFDDAQKLHECVLQDCDFFRRSNIVDYSLLVIIDTKKKRVRFGILDYCQYFSKAKQLEYVTKKFVVNFGGLPTIVPSDLYEMRFSNFMISNFIGVGTQMRKVDAKGKSKRSTKEQVKQSVLKEDENIRKVIRQSRKYDELRANLIQKTNQDPGRHANQKKQEESKTPRPQMISTVSSLTQDRNAEQQMTARSRLRHRN